jgi:hypothetical protein
VKRKGKLKPKPSYSNMHADSRPYKGELMFGWGHRLRKVLEGGTVMMLVRNAGCVGCENVPDRCHGDDAEHRPPCDLLLDKLLLCCVCDSRGL